MKVQKIALGFASLLISSYVAASTAVFTQLDTDGVYGSLHLQVSNKGQVVIKDKVWSRENGVEIDNLGRISDISSDGSKILANNSIYTNGELSFTFPPTEIWDMGATKISDDGKTATLKAGRPYTIWTEDEGYHYVAPGHFLDLSANGKYAIGIDDVVDLENGTSYTIPDNPDLYAVASTGVAVGNKRYPDALTSAVKEATLWVGEDTIRLGNLKGPGYGSSAKDISDNGNIVVGYSITDEDFSERGSGAEAFIWDSTNGMRSLEDVLQNEMGVDLGGWKLTYVQAISEDGYHIVGQGLDEFGNEAYWLVTLIDECTASAW